MHSRASTSAEGRGRLAGKTAIITGSAGGIGRATAALFAQEGAAICCVDLKEKLGAEIVQGIANSGGRAIFVAADVSRSADCLNIS